MATAQARKKAKAEALEFLARQGCPFTQDDAKLIGRELVEMAEEGIPRSPANILDRARAEDSPLHPYFEWNDSVAAERYRIDQARTLVSSIMIVERRTGRPARAFYSIVEIDENESRRRVYEQRSEVLVSDDKRRQVLSAIYARIRSACEEAQSMGADVEDPAWRRILSSLTPAPITADTVVEEEV